MVAELIKDKFGVRAQNVVGRQLAQLGITCQKPLRRAIERDEALVQRWLKKDDPKMKVCIKKRPRYISAMRLTYVRITTRGTAGVNEEKRRSSQQRAPATA